MKTESTDKEGGQTKWPNAYKTPARLALGLSRAPSFLWWKRKYCEKSLKDLSKWVTRLFDSRLVGPRARSIVSRVFYVINIESSPGH